MTPGNELKLGRAARHFKDVEALIAGYRTPNPYEIRREENPDTGLSFWIALKKEPDDDIALAAGDCIHNLRSALDHIIYELSCHMRKKHVGGTAFPIFINPKDWDAKSFGSRRFKTYSGCYKLRAIPDAARDWIELLQPYKGSDPMYWLRDSLLELHKLDITDKHRNLNLVVGKLPNIGVGYGYDGPALKVTYVHQGRLKEGTETLLLRFDPTVDLKVDVHPTTFFEVVFADSPVEGLEVVPVLRHLIWDVANVLQSIRKYF